ncbi:MAG: hypothetical protein WD341_06035, partial [Tistlia sp.]|uniref:hypothetical protein n=1 Tax=Tistlia sp. TaxID=3057121 RepID=UPI0034A2C8DB
PPPPPPTVEDWTEAFCHSAWADWGDDEAGRLRVWLLQPASGAAQVEIESLDLLAEPVILSPLEVPAREQRVTWRERVEAVGELLNDGDVDDPTMADAYQVSDPATEALVSKWPGAGVRLHSSRFYAKADADALAVRMRDTLGNHRPIEVTLGRHAWLLKRHDEVRLSHGRLGLDEGESARVVALALAGDGGTAVLYQKLEE